MARYNYRATQTITLILAVSDDSATSFGATLDTLVPMIDAATAAAVAQITAGSPGTNFTVSLTAGPWESDRSIPLIGPAGS